MSVARISLVLLLLLPIPAHAEALSPWSLSAGSAWARLGPAAHPTGGLMIAAAVIRAWPLSERARIEAGGELAMVGPDGGTRWIGLLGGPVASLRGSPWAAPLEVGVSLHGLFGRLPVITAWGLPINYSGAYPGASAALRYQPSPRAALELSGGALAINTLAYIGPAGWGGLNAVLAF